MKAMPYAVTVRLTYNSFILTTYAARRAALRRLRRVLSWDFWTIEFSIGLEAVAYELWSH